MTISRRSILALGSLATAAAAVGCRLSSLTTVSNEIGEEPIPVHLPGSLWKPDRARRILDRAGFGARPGDQERISEIGFETYLEEQCHPDSIADRECDSVIGRLATYWLPVDQLLTRDRHEVTRELMFSAIARPLYSNRQLYESMVEFWSDHFNIFIGKSKFMPYLKLVDDRDVIRANALGKFKDLLYASARSPAMLVYLDNIQNHKASPNENYARELMELHTLGVDGGYSQRDVRELARTLTGWGVQRRGRHQGLFNFDPADHDNAEKILLNHTIQANQGENEVHQILDLLLRHPATAYHIAFKLVRRFVADTPPEDLVKQVARIFKETDGDIKSMIRHIFLSDEFAQAPQKLKRPFTFILSAIRATGADINLGGFRTLMNWLQQLGHVPFRWVAPDGYPDTSERLAGNILPRWNFALEMASGNLDGIAFQLNRLFSERLLADDDNFVRASIDLTIGGPINQTVHDRLLRYLASPTAGASERAGRMKEVIALLLCSPDFQWC